MRDISKPQPPTQGNEGRNGGNLLGSAIKGAIANKRLDSQYGWVADMMSHVKEDSVDAWTEVFEDRLRDQKWRGREWQYIDAVNVSMAALLEENKNADPNLKQMLAFTTSHVLQAEERVIRKHDLKPPAGRESVGIGMPTPEDRILNAMASLLEDARNEAPDHRQAMAKAAAEISGAVARIKELRQNAVSYERSAGHDIHAAATEAARPYREQMNSLASEKPVPPITRRPGITGVHNSVSRT